MKCGRFLVLFLILVMVPSVLAVELGHVEKLTNTDDYMCPLVSPDGSRIVFTGANFNGLYTLEGTSVKMISSAEFVGYAYMWSGDGRSVVTRKRMSPGFQCVQITLDGNEKTLGYARGKMHPPQVTGNLIRTYYSDRKELVTLTEDFDSRDHPPYITGLDGKIIVLDSGTTTVIFEGKDTYYLPVISPDQTRICFQGLESGLHITDITGKNHVKLGLGSDPVWTPDSRFLLFTKPIDDGANIIASDIYIIPADGSYPVLPITDTPDRVERHPDISPDGKHLFFDAGGAIYRGILQLDDFPVGRTE